VATTSTSSISLLDVPSLVSQLMTVERQPITKLNTKISNYQSQISTFGTLSSLTSTLQSSLTALTSAFNSYTATPSDSSIFAATADTTAVAGNYSVVVSQLAQAQTLATEGRASATAAITTAASDLTFVVGGASKTVSIGANASLNDIRDAINAAGIGVTASIVNDGSADPYRLTISAGASGTSNAVSSISITAPGDTAPGDTALAALLAYGGGQSSTVTEAQAAKDANLTVNGIAITSSSNVVSGAIQGVTLTLTAKTTNPATLTVQRDTGSVQTAINSFVSAYNALYSQMKSVSAYTTSGSSTTPVLAGDRTVRMMMDQVRGILTTAASGGTYSYLSNIGIAIQKDGTLQVDSSKLSSALSTNFAAVSSLFSSTTGFTTRLNTWANSALDVGGLISTRTTNLTTSIKTFNDQIDHLNVRMAALQQQYTTTYSNLNMFLAQANSTTNYLNQQFATKSS